MYANGHRGEHNTKSPTLLGHMIWHAVQRAGVDRAEVEDAVIGTVLTSGAAGARPGCSRSRRAGPASRAGSTTSRPRAA